MLSPAYSCPLNKSLFPVNKKIIHELGHITLGNSELMNWLVCHLLRQRRNKPEGNLTWFRRLAVVNYLKHVISFRKTRDIYKP